MVEIAQMMAARERRAARKQELLQTCGLPLLTFTMNIPGPVKYSPEIRRGFRLGRDLLLGQLKSLQLPVVHAEEIEEETGCEGFYAVQCDPAVLGRTASEIEQTAALGPLYDLEVLSPEGVRVNPPSPRRCLVCGKPAGECARSRSHTVPELQAATAALLKDALDRHDAECAASLAVRALLYEVCTTPKPGLVDRRNNGSHKDMDIYTFMRSSAALWPYFSECLLTGRATADQPAPETFRALRFPGRCAETRMFSATGGVNTHKGAIFSLGLVLAALGRLDRNLWKEPAQVLSQVSAMTKDSVEKELHSLSAGTAKTAGQHFYLDYGVTGVRGQAEQGFPPVLFCGLPVLEQGLAEGRSADEAGCAAMLSMLARTTDTNMISRGGIGTQRKKQEELRELLAETPYPDRSTLIQMDDEYIRENLSPGGSADLLALCWLLHFLKTE